MVGAASGGVLAGLFTLRRYIERAPLLRRLMLAPPAGNDLAERTRREALVDWHHLIGQHGTTTTPLTPSGKARFGEELVDVISDGEALPCGAPVTVVDVRGNRILVERS
jgi:hypothetical protein